MHTSAIVLVLCAAVLHASWNAMLKGGDDRLRAMVVMSITSALLSCSVIPFVPWPHEDSWPALLTSAALHVFYNLFLVRAYRRGDLGQVYPIARGISPMLITLGAAIFAGEYLVPWALAGIVLVSLGILSLARGWAAQATRSDVGIALTTGVFIAAYTLVDGIGARLSGHALAYTVWLFALDGLPMPIIYWLARGWHGHPLLQPTAATGKAAAGGAISLIAYGLVIWAASIGPMGPVSALRETSVVFAALIGRIFLAENLTGRRLLACLSVAIGACLLGYRS